jgi:hypothetical protein
VGGAWDELVWRVVALFLGALCLGSATAVAVAAPRFAPALLTRGRPVLVHGGMKRARVATGPATAALGFGTVGGWIAPAPAPSVGGIE